MIYEFLTHQRGIRILFIESVCTDPNIIEANILVSSLCSLALPTVCLLFASCACLAFELDVLEPSNVNKATRYKTKAKALPTGQG